MICGTNLKARANREVIRFKFQICFIASSQSGVVLEIILVPLTEQLSYYASCEVSRQQGQTVAAHYY